MNIDNGSLAPPFSMSATGGRTVSLDAMAGKPFVLYFYPRADTPGCTKEAQAFEAVANQLTSIGTTVIGVSKDSLKALEAFAAKYALTFPLASDPDGIVITAYGAWVEKSMYGKSYMGVDRSTILVDSHGKVSATWRKVKVQGHADAVLKASQTLMARAHATGPGAE